MVCTFGDLSDVTWWRELRLPTRGIVGRDGRLGEAPWGKPGWESEDPERSRRYSSELEGRTTKEAREHVLVLLGSSGDLVGEPRRISHPVKFYEKGDQPLEVITSRQWYVRNGAFDRELRQALLRRGRELAWVPPSIQARYQAWVEGLNGDWLVSRQRYFGVPFPVWYPLLPDGSADEDRPIVPSEDRLPVDPATDAPEGYEQQDRGRPGGFVGDPDVMDTWLTSSLSPEIAAGWEEEPELFSRVFPMDLRPQGHEIIRTWLFTTVLRSHLEHHLLPWRDALISGWMLDRQRQKMSKSEGNVLTPSQLLDRYGPDAVRYWAASHGPGADTAFEEGQVRVGRRLAIKLLNASRFVLGLPMAERGGIAEPLDRALLAALASLVRDVTSDLEGYDYARALQRTEGAFWGFCDDYLELVKDRAYGSAEERSSPSARFTLRMALSAFQRLLAPYLPFAAEEVWSWWHEGSIHRAPWPTAEELATAPPGEPLVLEVARQVLGEVRRAKTAARRSLRAEVERVTVRDAPERLSALEKARADLAAAAVIRTLETKEGDQPSIEVGPLPRTCDAG